MEIQNLINCIENNGLHYITCRLQMTWGQSDKVELTKKGGLQASLSFTALDGFFTGRHRFSTGWRGQRLPRRIPVHRGRSGRRQQSSGKWAAAGRAC